jgi:NADPH:quinone reductase-like Zn-dependent oxidoreductase
VQLREIDPPRIGPKDLLVRVRAASINPLDAKIRDGKVKTLLHYSFPLVLGNDLSGEIVDIGPEVTRFAKRSTRGSTRSASVRSPNWRRLAKARRRASLPT